MLIAVFILGISHAGLSAAIEINFEDAYVVLGHEGDPASFYVSDGLTIDGSYFGLIEGVSRGDSGNFDLEGSNGPASLAINDTGQIIDFKFDNVLSSFCFDIGTAFFSQLPDPPQIRVVSYNSGILTSSAVITITDTIQNGMGTWHEQTYQNIDRLSVQAVGGRLLWAVDNLRTNEDCIGNPPAPPAPPPQPGKMVITPVLMLLLGD